MKITYCRTDESPLVAWYSLSPIIKTFSREVGLEIEEIDASLSGLILSEFGYQGAHGQRTFNPEVRTDRILFDPHTIVIKPPCISANAAQLGAAVKELQDAGLPLEDYCEASSNPARRAANVRYNRLLGSVVNKLLRQGTMVRQLQSAWSTGLSAQEVSMVPRHVDPACQITSMKGGDFRSSEYSISADREQKLRIELLGDGGEISVLKDCVKLGAGDVASFSAMQQSDLKAFLCDALEDAKKRSLAFALQLKCSALKADEFIFAAAVKAYYRKVYEHYGKALDQFDVNAGLGLNAIADAGECVSDPALFKQLVHSAEADGPPLALNERDAVSHLHACKGPSIARTMADAIVSGGRVSVREGTARTATFVIPDSSYSGFYEAAIEDLKTFGLLRPGQVKDILIVGLTKDAAEEYGAQGTTFAIPALGKVRVVDETGTILAQHQMQSGGIWRMILASASAISDWIETTLQKASDMQCPAVFWLDRDRAHHREIIKKLESLLRLRDLKGADVRILEIREATKFVFQRLRAGQGVVAAVGNVLRDYLSELLFSLAGTNKHFVQSYSSLPRRGHLFEAGTGGTAPRIFQQFLSQNFLRWNPIADAWAFVGAYRHIARAHGDRHIEMLAAGLEHSISAIRQSRIDAAELAAMDTRVIHFFLAKTWAQWFRPCGDNERLSQLGTELSTHQDQILRELTCFMGNAVNLGGYYFLNQAAVSDVMRPSTTFNSILAA